MKLSKRVSINKRTVVIAGLFLIISAMASFTLVKVSERNSGYVLDKRTTNVVRSKTAGMDITEIIDYSLDFTAAHLSFSRYNRLNEGKANCVGYAKYCTSVCNTAIENNNINARARPVVGYIKMNGVNVCKVAESVLTKQSYKNFVKDHDFVEIRSKDKVYQFDPCLYDVMGMSCYSEQIRKR